MNAGEFLQQVSEYARRECLLDIGNLSRRVLVALSGGADSVALLLALRRLGVKMVAAHCNFGLRGEESDRDERFVRELCARHEVECKVRRFDVPSYRQEHNASVEMACRNLRYEWFETLRLQLDCEAIAVAHHADDDIETAFLNALRGTGIAGAAGIKPRNGFVVRPLLAMSRNDVKAFVADCGETYITDSSNLENVFARNRIRNIVLPTIEDEFPGARRRLGATVANLKECNALYRHMLDETISHYTLRNTLDEIKSSHRLDVSCDILRDEATAPLLLFEIARPFGFSRETTDRLLALYRANNYRGKYFYISTYSLTIKSRRIVIERFDTLKRSINVVDLHHTETLPSWLGMAAEHECGFDPAMVNGTTRVAFNSRLLELDKIVIRPWRTGDRMRPFGMNGTKLVSDLLAERGFTQAQKRAVRVVEANQEVLWVMGVRAADAYRVEPGSKDYVLMWVKDEDAAQ